MTVYLAWNESSIPLFVKCLESLQNLHTLEIGRTTDFSPTLLEDALTGVTLPQIKTLVMPPIVHPLLQHCHDVEDVVCVVMDKIPLTIGSLDPSRPCRVQKSSDWRSLCFCWIISLVSDSAHRRITGRQR